MINLRIILKRLGTILKSRLFFLLFSFVIMLTGLFLIASDYYTRYDERKTNDNLNKRLTDLYYSNQTEKAESKGKEPEKASESPIIADTHAVKDNEVFRLKMIKEINKEIVGWISIEGTKIDYPVLQHKDNIFYLKINPEGKSSPYGSIFLDFRTKLIPEAENLVVYGHNMHDGSMFGGLNEYSNDGYLKQHPFIRLETYEKIVYWEIISVNNIDLSTIDKPDYDPAVVPDKIKKAAWEHQSKAVKNGDLSPYSTRSMLTLVTCSYNTYDERLIIHAAKKKETFISSQSP